MRTFCQAFKALLATMISLGLFCVLVSAAFAAPIHPTMPAHATVLSSDPAIGSTITSVPTKVTVTVAENLNPDPTKSNLLVYGPSGEATDTLISQGNAQIPLSNSKEMSISITPNKGHTDGVYVVEWKSVSADDGDPAAGAFSFTVNTSGASSTPTPSTTQNQTTPPTSTNNTTNASGIPVWALIVTALVALIVGLGLGRFIFAGRSKPAPSSFSSLRAAAAKDVEPEEANKRL